MREFKENLPDILQAKGLIARAPAYENPRNPREHSSSGFINTASILEKAEYSSIDDIDNDSNKCIKDDPFPNDALMNIEEDSKKSELLTAKLEDNQNICQDKDTVASEKASESVCIPRNQRMCDEIEGSRVSDTETRSKVKAMKSRKDSREWKDDNDYGREENNDDLCNISDACVEKKKEAEKRTSRRNSESCEDTEQEQSVHDCFSTINVYTWIKVETAVKRVSNEPIKNGYRSVNITIRDRAAQLSISR